VVSLMGSRPNDDGGRAESFYVRLGSIKPNFDWA
jgi:hypothetical protein